jgi:hypothetical protein
MGGPIPKPIGDPLMCRCGHIRAGHFSEGRNRFDTSCLLCDCKTFSTPYFTNTLRDIGKRLKAHDDRLKRIHDRINLLAERIKKR